MTRTVGSQTRIGTVLPGAARLAKLAYNTNISSEARQRLVWLDWHKSHGSNVRLTCRHFGIAHRSFYRYHNRYKLTGLRGLENRSQRPLHVRQPTTPPEHIYLVRILRRANPEYSKYKLQVILARDHGIILSASTIGRIIKRNNLFFTRPVKPKRHPNRVPRLRKPPDLQPTHSNELIEFDVKHLPMLGVKRYGFVAIDVINKRTMVHVATTISSRQAAIAWSKVCLSWGRPQAVLNDNGSENLGAFQKLLKDQNTPQYFARPRTPKDKPHVERFIGTLERECIQWGGLAIDTVDQQAIIDEWLVKYHSYRPHQALGYLTPDEYRAKLDADVALML